MSAVLDPSFYCRDCLEVAPELVGKILVHRLSDGTELRERISETEAYRGEEDLACHASKGRTKRTEVMYSEGGTVYVYLCYGIHWLVNVITGKKDQPQGVLIRCGEVHKGPAKLAKHLHIDGNLNGTKICGESLWIEDDGFRCSIRTDKRVGIDYAGDYWKNVEWRYISDRGGVK